jgi:hypothetical protein
MNWFLLLFSLLNAPPGPATAPAASQAADRPTVILVVGAEGAPEYAPDFAKAADQWADAARRGGARVVEVGRAPESTAPGQTDHDRLKSAVDAQAAAATAQPLWLVLIGHGTSDGREAKFNLRGPDVSDQDLKAWLTPCKRPLAVIDCSSASGPFLPRLSGPNRVVITATQSGQEIQYARFAQYLAAAIADPAADLDKDGQTSLLEAFIAAGHGVDEFYKSEGRLLTEHALIDDNGDTRGTPASWFQGIRATRAAKDNTPLDGPRAHQWCLVRSPEDQATPPDVRARRDDLELKVEALRAKKTSLSEADYYAELERLLIDLARTYEPSVTPK